MKDLKVLLVITSIMLVIVIALFSYKYFKPNFCLDVIQIIDERFKYLDEKQVETVLTEVSKIMKEKFNSDINFKYIKKVAYRDFKSQYSNINGTNKYNKFKFDIFDLKNDENLVPYVYYNYKNKFEIEELKEFITDEYEFESDDYKDIIGILLAIHRQKINQIKNIRLNNKMSLLEKKEFNKNSLVNWTNIVENCKYDLIITNSLIIDDFYDIPPHSLVRGGVLFGFAPKSNAKYETTAVVSIFPIITRQDYFIKERGYYRSEEELDMIAYTIIHELLHSLFKYGDHYRLKKCPINPIRGLRIKEWYKNLKSLENFDISTKKSCYYLHNQ